MVYLHLLCFQSTVVWEESASSFIRVGINYTWKEKPSAVDFK